MTVGDRNWKWLTALFPSSRQVARNPVAKTIELDPLATDYVRILSGYPETVSMRSGSVVLLPSMEVGKHSTGNNEEAIVVFSGTGELRLPGGVHLKLKPYLVAYCPPDTEHNVVNTGTEPLRYVYVVANAQKGKKKDK